MSDGEKNTSAFPSALQPPTGPVTAIDAALIEQAVAASRKSPRGRVILPFHTGNADTLQRMLNAVQPGSYITPHRHGDPPKAESIVVLRGSIGYTTFTDDGRPDTHVVLGSAHGCLGVDTHPGIYHTFLALEPDTVLFEVKPGPYDAATDKQFAPWAPAEGTAEAAEFLAGLERSLRNEP